MLETLHLAADAGFPPGVLNVVNGEREAGEVLVDHPGVAKVSFISSETTGADIASRAAPGSRPSRSSWAGRASNIVFPEFPLDAAEAGVLAGIFAAGGQSCVAGSRPLPSRSTTSCRSGCDAARPGSSSVTRWTMRPRWARSANPPSAGARRERRSRRRGGGA